MQVDVSSDELLKILKERKKHHDDKSAAYSKQAGELTKVISAIEEDMDIGKVSNGTPAESMERKAREHSEKARYYEFMIDHVIKNDTYRLSQEDLVRLGITARIY